ncbi:ABC transporter permease [Streptomyces phaeofaciens]|nr:ABC transporter permease [Streptomyces phaeofaciens]
MTNFLSFRALFNWSRPSDFFLAFVFAPAFDLLFYSFFGRFLSVENEEFYLSGGVTLATCLPALSGGVMSVTSERYYGTLEAFLISPGAFGAGLILRPLPYALFGAVAGFLTLPVGVVLLGVNISGDALPFLLACLLCGALSSAALGMLLGVLALYVRDVFIVINLAVWFLSLALGLFVPPSAYPSWLTTVAHWIPGYHALGAARSVMEGNDPLIENLAIEVIRAAILIGVGVCAIIYYRRQVRHGRTTSLG